MDADLTCAGAGLVIGADGVFLDLNGYTLEGTTTTTSILGVDNTAGYDRLEVANGTIVGFGQAVRVEGANKVQLKHLVILGDRDFHAIEFIDSSRVQIKHVTLTMTSPVFFAEAIRLESVDNVKVHNVDIDGGFIGVNFACFPCVGSEGTTTGSVRHSTFTGNIIGILIANSDDALVRENHVSGSVDQTSPFLIGSKGISVDSDFGTGGNSVTGVVLKDNHVHDNEGIGIRLLADPGTITSGILVNGNFVYNNDDEGILLVETDASDITKNLVYDNGADGIALTSDSDGNDITDNAATGHTTDISHDGTGTGNTWTGNTCDTSSGAGIDCP